ncbi:MAG: hypothetical protein REI12_10745 [Pedobacter sp.]|nr:hypothetical protein [Pedobacter sp.]
MNEKARQLAGFFMCLSVEKERCLLLYIQAFVHEFFACIAGHVTGLRIAVTHTLQHGGHGVDAGIVLDALADQACTFAACSAFSRFIAVLPFIVVRVDHSADQQQKKRGEHCFHFWLVLFSQLPCAMPANPAPLHRRRDSTGLQERIQRLTMTS